MDCTPAEEKSLSDLNGSTGNSLPSFESSQVVQQSQLSDLEPSISWLSDINQIELQDFMPDLDQLLETVNNDIRPGLPCNIEVDSDDSPWIGQWNRFSQLTSNANPAVQDQMSRYSQEFTAILEFRTQFCNAIERKIWHLIDPNDYQYGNVNIARAIVNSLQVEIEQFLSTNNFRMPDDLPAIARLRQWQKDLQMRYTYHPMELVQLVQKMLKKEQNIMKFAARQATPSMNNQPSMMVDGRNVQNVNTNSEALFSGGSQRERVDQIMSEVNQLEEQILRGAQYLLEQMTTEYQQLRLCTSGNVRVLSQSFNPTTQEERNMWTSLRQRLEYLIQKKQSVIFDHQKKYYPQLKDVYKKIQEEIAVWQRAQAYASNGKHFSDTCEIDQLEDCCKLLAKLLNTSLEQVRILQHLDIDTTNQQHNLQCLTALQQQYERTVQDLVENALVVEKQPPQVLMKDKKFVCHLRHLVGDGLSCHQFRFDTKVWLINTEAACAIIDGGHKVEIRSSGEILNNSAKADFVEQTKQVLVHMRNMSLRMRQRGDRGRADCVAEEKFCMVFRSFISLRFPSNTECNVVAQTMSLPVVVISHGKQEPDAQATIFWDNSFSGNADRRPFEVPDSVPWSVMLEELNWIWKKHCQGGPGSPPEEGIGLDEDAKRYLTIKLWGRDDRNVTVNWRQFNRDNLPGKSFTFWTWFFKIMELVSSPYVKKYWNSGLIKGFISKNDCQRLLMQQQLGTFMFRFSDSNLGAVSISCYTYSKFSGANEVGHLEPDTIAKFKARSLPDIVKDIKFLHFLYPNRPKDEVFSSHYTQKKQQGNDYWPKELHMTINEGLGTETSDLAAQSPGPFSPNSNMSPQVQMSALSPSGFVSPLNSESSRFTVLASPQSSMGEGME